MRRRRLELEIRGSIFCNARDSATEPHCRYYLAFVEKLVASDGFASTGQLTACRALGGDCCVVRLDVPEAGA